MARDFNGTTDSLSAGDVTLLDGATFSWSCWVYLDDNTSDHVVWEKISSSFTNGITIFFDVSGPGGARNWEVYYSSGAVSRIASSGDDSAATDQWVHLGGWYEFNSATGLALLIDGAHAPNSPVGTTSPSAFPDTGEPFLVGMHNNSGDRRWYTGGVADMAIWDARLTVAEFGVLAAGYTASFVRPASLRHHADLFGNDDPEIDRMGEFSYTTITGGARPHPPLIYPSRPHIITAPTAAPGGATPKGVFGLAVDGPLRRNVYA